MRDATVVVDLPSDGGSMEFRFSADAEVEYASPGTCVLSGEEQRYFTALCNTAAGMVYSLRTSRRSGGNYQLWVGPPLNWVLHKAHITITTESRQRITASVKLKGGRYQLFVPGGINSANMVSFIQLAQALVDTVAAYFAPWLTVRLEALTQ